ncbi:MAG: protein O-mannosyl-transferase family [Ignavibacteriaceae bacterium]
MPDNSLLRFVKKYFAVLTGLFVFLVYLTTLAPSVVEIDAGELATVQATLGIAHPTGYPLFTMLGYLFSLIPFGFSKIYQLNLLTDVWCSLGIMVFVYRNSPAKSKKFRIKRKQNHLPSFRKIKSI